MKKSTTYSIEDLPEDRTDLGKVKKLTERQINKAARTDKDVQPLTKKELKEFRRVHPPAEVNVRQLRRKLHISQEVFAALFGIRKRTLQDWEQGRRHPRGPARVLLSLIARRPKLVNDVLSK